MRAAISQSNYIPWKGYFDLIASVDTFMLFDDMQYTRRDWRNRNIIKTPNGAKWLTIPVDTKGKYHQKINATQIVDDNWSENHWNQIAQNYQKAPYFKETAEWLKPLYLENNYRFLSEWNALFISKICDFLDINTRIVDSRNFVMLEDRSARLADLCSQLGASQYVSGPAAKDYLDELPFIGKSIQVEWIDYSGYPEYPQLHGDFSHAVTILDLIFNTGNSAHTFMKFDQ